MRRDRRLGERAEGGDRRAPGLQVTLPGGLCTSGGRDPLRNGYVRRELRALGAPDTEFGVDARQAVETFATASEADLADVERAVENVSGLTGISKAVSSITAALTSMNKHFTTMVNSLRKIDPEKELQGALEDAESCDDFAS